MRESLSDREITREIIESCRSGDPAAFRALYELYNDQVYLISLYFFHGDQAVASDVTQQVFVKLLTSICQFRGEAGFSTWLYRLVVNACTDAARRRKSDAAGSDRSGMEASARPPRRRRSTPALRRRTWCERPCRVCPRSSKSPSYCGISKISLTSTWRRPFTVRWEPWLPG